MATVSLESARTAKGWTQAEAASKLGVSQGYLSLLERGLRTPSARLVETVRRVFDSQASLPDGGPARVPGADLARRLGSLGYEPLAYLGGRAKPSAGEVFLAALSQPDLEARLVEALPWVALTFEDLDWPALLDRARRGDLQNRFGYVLGLARRVAESKGNRRAAERVAGPLRDLEGSILLREDTLCRDSMTNAEREWLRDNRPDEAKHWRVLTDLRPEHLPYAA